MTNEAEQVKNEVCILMGAEAESVSRSRENIVIYEVCQDSEAEEKKKETWFDLKGYIGMKVDKLILNIETP